MRPLVIAWAVAALSGPAFSQTAPLPAPPLAPAPLPPPPSAVGEPAAVSPPPAVTPPPAPAPAAKPANSAPPVINIDPRGFTGGTGAGAFSGLGTIVIDPLAGGAANAPVMPQTSAGADAALRASTPTSLDPAPAADAYPFCRNPNDQRCRARPGVRISP